MKRSPLTLLNSDLHWQGTTPESVEFGDIFFNSADGIAESEFVFLGGSELDRALENSPSTVVGETGFGTGLNFLLSWKKWMEMGRNGRLTFISTEAHPLRPSDLERAHAAFPALEIYTTKLRSAMPPPSRGFHLRKFEEGQVQLLLLYGDAAEQLAELSAQIDIWYLDGFAPSKNPDMWSDELFDQIARLSKTGTRLATFTAAGFVRRGLADRGFDMQKTPGFGSKRERLVGQFKEPANSLTKAEHAWLPAPREAVETKVAIIGGGLAGRLTAQALGERRVNYDLYSSSEENPASEVPAAILAPRFLLDDQPASDLWSAAYAYSVTSPTLGPSWLSPRGLAIKPGSAAENERQAKLLELLVWGDDWIQPQDEGIYLPHSGTLDSKQCLSTLPHPTEGAIKQLEQVENNWWLIQASGRKLGPYSDIVVAAGINSFSILGIDAQQLTPKWGRTFKMGDAFNPGSAKAGTVSQQGTVSAKLEGHHWVGSSFSDIAGSAPEADLRQVSDKLLSLLEEPIPQPKSDWHGVRATTRDRLPYAGPLADAGEFEHHIAPYRKDAKTALNTPAPSGNGLYILSGFGSKGWQLGPLLGEMIAAQIAGDPVPLSMSVQAVLSPMRDAVKAVTRGPRTKS